MRKSWILLLIAAAAALWFTTVGGRRIDESHVRAFYRDYLAAYDANDGKAFCDLFDTKVTGQYTSTSRSMAVTPTFDKAAACAAVGELHDRKRALEARSGRELHTNFEVMIQSVVVAPDRKSATVEVLIESRIGDEKGALYDRRSQQTDTLTRRFGKTRVVRSDATVSFYRTASD